MQQNVRNKIICQNWAYDLHFVFWTLGLCQAFYYLLFIKVYKDRNFKNWVEDVIIFSVKNIHVLNFEEMKNLLCTNSSFINSIQNVQILLIFFDTNFMCDFWAFLLKTDVLVHNFWIVYTEVKMVAIFGNCISI